MMPLLGGVSVTGNGPCGAAPRQGRADGGGEHPARRAARPLTD
jgi:hypothetical protein